MKRSGLVLACVFVASCGNLQIMQGKSDNSPGQEDAEGQTRPVARPDGAAVTSRPPPANARSVEEFDTTTANERQAAAETGAAASEKRLGVSVATLGDPASPGFWLETPLVDKLRPGRVVFAGTGKSAKVELRPIGGAATAGSRLSLAAMRLIGAPLTGLPEIEVFAE